MVAIALGAHVLEFDVRVTLDNILVVCHDDKLDRTTDGTGFVRTRTLEEIKKLDAAYKFTPYHSHRNVDEKRTDEEDYPYRNKRLKIPTFREVLERFWGKPGELNDDTTAMNFNIEIKVIIFNIFNNF